MIRVTAVLPAGELELGSDDPTVLEAGQVLLAISAPQGIPVRLDGRVVPTRSVAGTRLLAVDLSRSTGFHHLQLGADQSHWFGTTDSKLRMVGIRDMLKFLREQCLGWTGQLVFSDGTRLRDVHTIYGWLDQHADRALDVARQIADRPIHRSTRDLTVTREGGHAVALRPTLSLLRRRPHLLLAGAEGGSISLPGGTFTPLKVVAKTRKPSEQTVANRRAAWVVIQVGRLAAEAGRAVSDPAERQRTAHWVAEARMLLARAPFAPLVVGLRGWSSPPRPVSEETTESRYAASFSIAQSLKVLALDDPTLQIKPIHTYVSYADQIFQAFVAAVLAEALGLMRVSGSVDGPQYSGNEWRLFANTHPPARVIRSWRSYGAEPDVYRPDVLLEHVPTGRTLIGDAKYRNEGARASEDSRKELLSYMGAYGVDSVAVFYPPDPPDALSLHRLEGQSRRLLEVPIAPVSALWSYVTADVLPALLDLVSVPPWRD
ncbi:hypothetical protein BH23CHL7_BH23CHL7_20350 [soil metagenome]